MTNGKFARFLASVSWAANFSGHSSLRVLEPALYPARHELRRVSSETYRRVLCWLDSNPDCIACRSQSPLVQTRRAHPAGWLPENSCPHLPSPVRSSLGARDCKDRG